MKGIMFNTKYGLEQAVLDGTKTRTWRADKKPRYEVGEVLAIKQSYFDVLQYHKENNNVTHQQRIIGYYSGEKGWRNKMFTRNEEMPHRIKITKVTPCKLQDITNEECMREGIFKIPILGSFCGFAYENAKLISYKPYGAFALLIKNLNGKDYWKSNPDGYAYEFELNR